VLDASLILLVLFLVAVGITFSVIRMAWLGRRDRVSQPCCAACRYKVRGLQSWTCPECGSDLREVGILTRGLRVVRSISTFEMIALWTSMIGTIAVLSIAGLGSLTQFRRFHMNREHTVSSNANLVVNIHDLSFRPSVPKLHLIARSVGSPQHPDQSFVTLKIVDSGDRPIANPTIEATFQPSETWTLTKPDGADTSVKRALTREDIATWLASSGYALDTPAKHAEIDELYEIVRDMVDHPLSPNVSITKLNSLNVVASSWSGPDQTFLTISTSAAVLVWIAGGIFLAKRMKRRRISATIATAPPARPSPSSASPNTASAPPGST